MYFVYKCLGYQVMKIDTYRLCNCAIVMGIVIMVISIAIFLLSVSVLLVNEVYDTVWGEPCVCEGVADGNKQT